MPEQETIVITGAGLTSPLGNELATLRRNLLGGVSGVSTMETRFMGEVFAGICNFDEKKHQSSKERRRGTRAGSISIFCANEAVANARLDLEAIGRSRIGIFIGVTEHGTVETENEINVIRGFDYD